MPSKTDNTKHGDAHQHKRQAVAPVGQDLALLAERISPLTQSVQRAVLEPGRARPADILALQRTAGNRAVSRLLQAKLTVGPAGDRYEQEADRVAEQVLRMPVLATERWSVPPPVVRPERGDVRRQDDEEEIQAQPLVQRQEEEELQMRPAAPLQRQEDEEDLQMRPAAPFQRQEDEEDLQTMPLQRQEDEEDLQMKPLQRQEDEEDLQMKPLQRQEDEEDLQTMPLQRQEDEEDLQMKPLQRQEDEEDLQMMPLQRQEDEEDLQMKPLQREEEDEELQAKPSVQRQASGGFEAGPEMENRLASQKGGGNPLPDETRAFMEPRFGADFSGVRVHTGGQAAQMSKELRAQAFTHGQDVYFGTGRYDPGTGGGKRLLAHELTHVVQQGGARTKRSMVRTYRAPDPKPHSITTRTPTGSGLIQRETFLVNDIEIEAASQEEANRIYQEMEPIERRRRKRAPQPPRRQGRSTWVGGRPPLKGRPKLPKRQGRSAWVGGRPTLKGPPKLPVRPPEEPAPVRPAKVRDLDPKVVAILNKAAGKENYYNTVREFYESGDEKLEKKHLLKLIRFKGRRAKGEIKDRLDYAGAYLLKKHQKWYGNFAHRGSDWIKENTPKRLEGAEDLKKLLKRYGISRKGKLKPELATVLEAEDQGLYDAVILDDEQKTKVDVGPRIEVRVTKAPGEKKGLNVHSFIVYTDEEGKQELVVQGGGEPLTAEIGPYSGGSHEFDTWHASKRTRVLEQAPPRKADDVKSKWDKVRAQVPKVEKLDRTYNVVTRNCNTVASWILKQANVKGWRWPPLGLGFPWGWGFSLKAKKGK